MSPIAASSVNRPKLARRALGLSPVVWLLGLGACTSVLGIEDLHDGPRPDGTGDTNAGGSESTNTGGKSNTGGKNNTGGSTSPGGSSDNPGAGAGNEPSGGTGNMAGAGNEAGAGGAVTPVTGPVTGKVIDRWSVPIADVTVQIGAQQVSTDSKGVFTVPNVPATYDLSLLVNNGDGWVYQGLTRRDPTLQVFRGHPYRSNFVDLTPSKATLVANEQISLAVSTPTGSVENPDTGIDFPPLSMYPEWEGGTSTPSTFHGLKWTKNATTHVPVAYKAYDAKPLALVDSVDGAVTLDFTVKTITAAAVTGTVTPIADGTRVNSVFVRFGSGASIQLVDDTPGAPNTFSYVVPTLADSSITVAAWEGNYLGPLGLVHKDGLKPGDATGALDIPAPPTVLTPTNQAPGVTETTMFSFKGSPDNAGAFLVILHSIDTDAHLYIVTTQKKFSIPSVVDGAWVLEHATADPPAQYEWWVETHGHFATVDEMTGPNGYVDEFGVNYITPVAIHQADGTYTYSAAYEFTTKNQ
jgi:hypothetical protein